MDVPSAALEKLQCENCESYLSRGPVLMLKNGKSRCGRCLEPEERSTRNIPYEELAKLMKFPCRYQGNGCTEKVTFDKNKSHEDACIYREFICPIVEPGKCEWTGLHKDLMPHCQEKHADNVVRNPIKFTHNIAKASLDNFLLSALQVLFLVQTKVCLKTKNIYHSVRLIGDPACASKYEFELTIQNKRNKLTREKEVAPQGFLALQEDTSIVTSINLMLGFLGDYEGTTFTIIVRQIKAVDQKLSLQVKCVECSAKAEKVWRDDKGWRCTNCTPKRQSCRYKVKGCKYTDINLKHRKHLNFCSYSKYCMICQENSTHKSLNEHYSDVHSSITNMSGDVWNTDHLNTGQWRIINADFGYTLCHYWQYGSKLFVYVRSSLPSEQLFMYKCVVELSHPVTGCAKTWIMQAQYFYVWDWELNKPDVDIYSFCQNNQYNIKIDFIKDEPPSYNSIS